MKKLFIILALFSLISFQSKAQRSIGKNQNQFSIELANNTVRSIYGWKTGPKVNMNFNNRIELNYAYLFSVDGDENGQSSFQSTQVKYYLNPKGRVNLGLGLKLGLYDNQFAAVIPSIDLRYRPIDDLNVSAGFARVDGFPYFDLSLGIRVFSK